MAKWSGDVQTKWDPPDGLFTKSASEIAKAAISDHRDKNSARKALDFYINRAGKKLSQERRSTLEKAKRILMGESAGESILRKRSYRDTKKEID